MKRKKLTIEEKLLRAAETIQNSSALIIMAGAGMGVDSGLPDFRGKNGFWKAYPILKQLGMEFTRMASPKMFELNPKLAWGFYGQRLNLYRQTQPHIGFDLLRKWGEDRPSFVVTTNVDGQFQKAGFDEQVIYEVHGSIHHLQEVGGKSLEIIPAKNTEITIDSETLRATNLPVNEEGRLLRPNILMFDDWEWLSSRADAQEKAFDEWLSQFSKTDRIVILEFGAGDAIPTLNYKAQYLRRHFDTTYIKVNPNRSRLKANLHIELGALEAIKKLDALMCS
jgi:NAD-dependent SIR2 family protein deacetylase